MGIDLETWAGRAKLHGRRAALNIGMSEDDYDAVTRAHQGIIGEVLDRVSVGKPRTILDFGCGPGQFSGWLADRFNAPVIAYDPCDKLLGEMPIQQRVVPIPILPNAAFDLVWVMHVLGGLEGTDLEKTIAEIVDRMDFNSALFLSEHIAEPTWTNGLWTSRPAATYERLFAANGVRLRQIADYEINGLLAACFIGSRG